MLWSNGSEHWSERWLFIKPRSAPREKREICELLRKVEVGSVDVGSVFRGLRVWKFRVAEEHFLPATVLRRLKTARGFEWRRARGGTDYCRWPDKSRPWHWI